MPESPEVKSFGVKTERHIDEAIDKCGTRPTARLLLPMRCYTVGTKAKSYHTISWRVLTKSGKLVDTPDPTYQCNKHDMRSAKTYRCVPLVDRPLEAGPLFFAIRGKCMVLAAGYHAVSINFGLEACLYIIPLNMFYDLLANDSPGPNPDKKKAAKLRTFKFPPYLIEESRAAPEGQENKHSINIFCAFLTDTSAIVISDFSRLVRLRVTSLDRFWTEEDLQVGSHHWNNTLFEAFPDGPDWVTETDAAYARLNEWRKEVLGGKAKTIHSIVEAITTNTSMAFGGFGRHLANDFLHKVQIHPLLSPSTVCADVSMWKRLYDYVATYMAQWHSPTFLSKCCVEVNSRNPFTFNASQERNYLSQYVIVHSKKKVRLPIEEYNSFVSLGLLDPDHVIGMPYQADPSAIIQRAEYVQRGYKEVPVYQYEEVGEDPLRAFSIIVAKFPENDNWRLSTADWTDIRTRGNATTLGPASFRETMQNRPVMSSDAPKRKPGRPSKPKGNGKKGRPVTRTLEARLAIPKSVQKKDEATQKRKREAVDSDGPNLPAASPPSPMRTRTQRDAAAKKLKI